MAQFTTTSQLSGHFYEVYSDKELDLIPASAKLVGEVPFVSADKELGNKYHQPVIVSEEAGVTYAAAGDGAFTLNNSVSMSTQDAQVDGYQLVLRSSMDYEAAAKASTTAKAFAKATGLQVKNMLESARRRLEMSCWYGQSGLGVVDTSANASSTSTVLTITTASHAPLIWAGRKNAILVAYNGTTVVSSTSATYTITSVDVVNRTVTVSGSSGDISALDTAISGNPATIKLYWQSAVSGTGGSFAHKDMAGLDAQTTNTGTIFNIDASTYDLFKPSQYSVSSNALTLARIQLAVAQGVNRGLDEDVTVWVNPITWTGLSTDQASLRRYNAGETTAQNGFKAIEFYHMNGIIRVVGHGMIKAGEAFVLPMKRIKRIGATDVSFKIPGLQEGEDIFLHVPDKAGYEYRLYSHQAIFLETPAKAVKITNIVN